MPSSRSEDLRVERSNEGGLFVLALHGSLDVVTAERLEHAYAARADGQHATVVDLRQVSFMDSTGLAALLKLQKAERERGRQLALIRGPHAIKRLFVLSGINQLFDFVTSPREALRPSAQGDGRTP